MTQNLPKNLEAIPTLHFEDKLLLPGCFLSLNISDSSKVNVVEKHVWPQALNQAKAETPSILPSAVFPVAGGNLKDQKNETWSVGCLGRVLKIERVWKNDDRADYLVVLEGLKRCKVVSSDKDAEGLSSIELLSDSAVESPEELRRVSAQVRQKVQQLLPMLRRFGVNSAMLDRLSKLLREVTAELVVDIMTNYLDFQFTDKVAVLQELDRIKRMSLFLRLLDEKESKRSPSATKSLAKVLSGSSSRPNRIQGALGDNSEVEELEKKITEAGLPAHVQELVDKELKRLSKMMSAQHEYSVLRSFLECVADLPWNAKTEDTLNLEKAKQQLDSDHYGLRKVKERILQYLAVRKLTKEQNDVNKSAKDGERSRRTLKAPVLCLVGAPGIGKTSLGASVASALNRKFHRIALGGVRDVADIKGHRRTYVGSLPGMIINALRTVKVNNPVILLDEIDKLGVDSIRGDPSSALLEVLDPEQNFQFVDHYLSLPFDLSDVLFICTANSIETIPAPLLDRMELVQMNGYTLEDKINIARNYLLQKVLNQHGIPKEQFEIPDDVLRFTISSYTREPGVRSLERELAAICRVVAIDLASMKEKDPSSAEHLQFKVTRKFVEDALGPIKYEDEFHDRIYLPGVVCGLSWISSGNGSLLFIEATCFPGTGKLTLTGRLGEVIKESAQTALSWVKANAHMLPLKIPSFLKDSTILIEELFNKIDIHIHLPAGAISKEGPSAGVALTVAIVSLLSEIPCKERIAITGEVTLRGTVLPVGGIVEKYLAAHRGGIKSVIIPERNRKDVAVDEIPDYVKNDVTIHCVKRIEEALKIVLGIELPEKKPLFANSSKQLGPKLSVDLGQMSKL
ncbi:hypothetical protein MP638_000418 [Amoeboaphelidium occidentale]|nr:hypothetical protein MP638_000418 [Amoeboaphelidium occidentale]